MRLKTLLSAALISLSTSAIAQSTAWTYDSVAMGAGYANDIFYELNQGATTPNSGSNWDLAFQMSIFGEPMFNACARTNHARKSIQVYSLGLQASVKWSNLAPADTIGKTAASVALFNNDTSWGNGAFYQNRLPTDPFSFGWGEYSPSANHSVNGDLIYLIKMGGDAYKFWIQKYVSTPADSISYTFRIAKLDGTNDNSVKIMRKADGFSDRLFAYYDIATNKVLDREPSRKTWDLLFTRYSPLVYDGSTGAYVPYPSTGVLANLYTEIADVRHLNPDDIGLTTGTPNYYRTKARTTQTDEIGADWKTYVNPGPSGYYQMDDSASFIIKSKLNLNYYQIQFTRFDGGGAGLGKIVFRKRYLGTALSVPATATQALNALTIAPNPASNDATLMLDAKRASAAQMVITDMAGRVLQSASLDLKSGINAFSISTGSWPAGVYAVQIVGTDWKAGSRIAVTH